MSPFSRSAMESDNSTGLLQGSQEKRKPRASPRRKLYLGGGAMVLLVTALAIGLGVGITQARHHRSTTTSAASSTASPTSSGSPTATSTPAGLWKPSAGMSWNYELLNHLNSSATNGISVWDIDLFDNSASVISGIQASGGKVICYFSAGSYENWRPDKDSFTSGDLGNNLDGWPGERWLNTNTANVRQIMQTRLDMAVSKGCNGVDPDNVDGYNNDNGLGLTQDDSVNYVKFLADAAHQRGLAVGLKNAGDIIPDVIDVMDWSVNEQCLQYNECDTYQPFIAQNKPVFHVEYPKGADTDNNLLVSEQSRNNICDNASAKGFSTIIKNMNLDPWIERC